MHQEESTRQYSVQASLPEKPSPETRLYHKVLITKKGLREALEIEFAKYRILDQLPIAKAVIACESSWNWQASNKVSYGLLEFTPATWKDFGYGDIMNPYTQIRTMAKMWGIYHLQSRWDCWRALQ